MNRKTLDHSALYDRMSIRNIPHRYRLKRILRIFQEIDDLSNKIYADVGCGTGYITNIVKQKFNPAEVYGLDYSEAKLEVGRQTYHGIYFSFLDLNQSPNGRVFDVVSCFETLEHTGQLETTLDNLIRLTRRNGGYLVITVPIEIGFWGLLKFIAKTVVYRGERDDLKELPLVPFLYVRYLAALLLGQRMSRFRDERYKWGTHYGFDHRDIDDQLAATSLRYTATNAMTTRYYVIMP